MSMHILILHGLNLNLLGQREPEVYGRQTLADINESIAQLAKELFLTVDFFQSNHEGDLIDKVQAAARAAGVAVGQITGFGAMSYLLALRGLAARLS